MRFHAAISESEESIDAGAEVVASTRGALSEGVDFVFAFLSPHHCDVADVLLERLWLELDPQCIVGCSAGGVIGGEKEIEQSPGISILAGQAKGVRIHSFHIGAAAEWNALLSNPEQFRDKMGINSETRAVIGFGDPFSTPLNAFLAAYDTAAPHIPLLGGMASSGQRPGSNVLLKNDRANTSGFVGVSLGGELDVQTVVSQGCRSIGRHMVITRAHDNVIEHLGGKPALEALRQVVTEMTEQERELLENGLMVGTAISEYRERFGRGDYLIRNLIGVDENTGSISLADYVRTGQTAQFHVRDAATATEDLELLLETQKLHEPAAGGLIFSCNGRGTRLFPQPCHDIAAARNALPATPFAGFFAAGEFGPVGGRSFVHGHTASIALFRDRK